MTLSTGANWYKDSIAAGDTAKWYKFTAEAAKTYHVQWWDNYLGSTSQPSGKNKTAEIKVTAYKEDGTTAINSAAWTLGWMQMTKAEITAETNETFFLKVERYGASTNGTYAIRVYDVEAIVPQEPLSVFRAEAMAKDAVRVSWTHYVPSLATKEYKLYRSDSKDGTYTQIDAGESLKGKESSIFGWSISTSYVDTTASAGKSYWYKIVATNDAGDSPKTAALQSDTVGAYSSATEFPAANFRTTLAATKDDLTAPFKEITFAKDEIKWYKFTATAGKTYKVQWAESGSSTSFQPSGAGYTGDVDVSAFKPNGDYVSTIAWEHKLMNWAGNSEFTGEAGDYYLKFDASKPGTIGFTIIEN